MGKTVTLCNVAIQDINSDGNFWAGRDGCHRLLIVKQDNNPNLTALDVRKGHVVNVNGTVKPASKYQSNVTSSRQGSMHDAEKSSGLVRDGGRHQHLVVNQQIEKLVRVRVSGVGKEQYPTHS